IPWRRCRAEPRRCQGHPPTTGGALPSTTARSSRRKRSNTGLLEQSPTRLQSAGEARRQGVHRSVRYVSTWVVSRFWWKREGAHSSGWFSARPTRRVPGRPPEERAMGKGIKEDARTQVLEPVSLGELIHRHIRIAIERAVHEELRAALGTGPYERRDVRRGYRNGVRERT